MVAALVPFRWGDAGRGSMNWLLPAGVTSAVSLQKLATLGDPKAVEYAVATIDGPLPEGAVELETGNETRDRDAWASTLGFRPEGTNVREMTKSHLEDGADDTGDAACRPYRCGRPDRIELHLGGKVEWATNSAQRTKQAALVRRDLDAVFDAVERGELPPGMHRKFLQAEADRLGLDPLTLRSKSARWRNERPEKPETTITDPFKSGGFVVITSYTPPGAGSAYTTVGENGARFQTGDASDGLGPKIVCDAGSLGIGAGNANNWAWHPTSLSSSNCYWQLDQVLRSGGGAVVGVLARGNGSNQNYFVDNYGGSIRGFYHIAGVGTSIGSPSQTAALTRDDLWLKCLGSTISFGDVVGVTKLSITNTAVTAGLRGGVFCYSSGGAKDATGLYARDYVTPVVSANSASAAFGAGGTVQMSATNDPTSWSLPGSPPTGVSINSSGIITWTGATPAAVHSVTVRATHDGGSGDGTLTLTITSAASGHTRRTLLGVG
jgi:hypothetical protein